MGLSIGIGGDIGYYERGADDEYEIAQAERAVTEQLHEQPERASDYYSGDVEAGRELPGQWLGPGAESLGLHGKVNSWQLHKLYGEHIDPISGDHLGSKPRNYSTPEERLAARLAKEPYATPERVREIELSVSPTTQHNRPFFDLTFSLPKSYSILHAALLAAGRDAEAQKILDAHHHAIDECMKHYMDEAGFSRKGHHGRAIAGRTSGERIGAHDWIYSRFDHRTSRCGDMQLHSHVLLLNKSLSEDGVWRTLDSATIVQTMARSVGALHERFMAEETARTLGISHRARLDGFGWEVEGIEQADIDEFSTRRRAIETKAEGLVAQFVEKYNREPTARERDDIMQSATLLTRPAKPHEKTYEEYLASWDERFEQARGEHLADILDRVPMTEIHRPAGLPGPSFDRSRVIELAIASVAQKHASWSRPQLRQALSDTLPPNLGLTSSAELLPLLDSLVDEATRSERIATLSQPAAVEAPLSLCHSNGRSIYEPTHVERWATAQQLSTEADLVAQLHDTSGPRITGVDAERLITETTLHPDQAAVYREVLTSGRRLNVLVAPAGTGKSFTVGQLSKGWNFAIGGRVVGLSKNQIATDVMRDEGVEVTFNIDQFLTAHRAMADGNLPSQARAALETKFGLGPQSLVIIDEVSTVSDDEKYRIVALAKDYGASVLMVGDPEQVGSVDVGSALRLLTAEVEPLRLETVRRFDHQWEGPASLGLRERQAAAILQYDTQGRIVEGTREEVTEKALMLTVADFIEGREALLMVGTTELARELSSHVRQRLVDAGHVDVSGGQARLHDLTACSPGDRIQARLTTHQIAGAPLGDSVANRAVFDVQAVLDGHALMVRQLHGRNDDGSLNLGEPRVLPAEYVAHHVELAYATTVHSKIGRTVERAYSLVTDSMDWHALYTAMTRGKDHNVAFVPVRHEEGVAVEKGTDVLARLAERPERDLSATEALRAEMDAPTHLARLGPIYDNELTKHVRSDHQAIVANVLGTELAERVAQEAAAEALYRLTRALEAEGHDAAAVLAAAVAERELGSAESVSEVLHWRITQHVGPVRDDGEDFTARRYVEQVPAGDSPELEYLRATAEVMDRRVAQLGEQQVEAPEPWATAHLGPVPDDVIERVEWAEKAAQVAAYRERYGVTDEHNPIGAAPGRKAVDQRADWEQSYRALGRPAENEDVARKTDGELMLDVEQYRRIEAWMPPDVSERLKLSATAARDYAAQAVHDRAAGDVESAQRAERLSARMAERVAQLEEVVAARREAEAFTAAERDRANVAQLELDRRCGGQERSDDEAPASEPRELALPTMPIEDALERARDVNRQLEAERAIEEAERVAHEQEIEHHQEHGYEH